MASSPSITDSSGESSDEDFSVIERLADAIRIEEDVRLTPEDKASLVKDLYEGPRKCACCVNWVDEQPEHFAAPVLEEPEKDVDDGPPIVIRRRVTVGEASALVAIETIQIRHATAREVLLNVFNMYDNLVCGINHLVFRAPFHPFFWHWARFDNAVADEDDPETRKVLVALRAIVKQELAEAFAITKELTSHGVISSRHLWTLFAPGSLVYERNGSADHLYIVESFDLEIYQSALHLRYVDWNGRRFGSVSKTIMLYHFFGTRRITTLPVFPAAHLEDLPGVQARLLARGRKFASLAGMHYKTYRPRSGATAGGSSSQQQQQEEARIVVDSSKQIRHPGFQLMRKKSRHGLPLRTYLVCQEPIDNTKISRHIPLRTDAPNGPPPPHVPPYGHHVWRQPGIPPPAPPPRRSGIYNRERTYESEYEDDDVQEVDLSEDGLAVARNRLTDMQLQLCASRVPGYNMRTKTWGTFDVDRVEDIAWNTEPFESLVLPEGYKDLILSFVESQVKEGDTFDDVINGKGGGLVILLAGEPGVGKTLTAESVAEKIHAPLYKLELAEGSSRTRASSRSRSRTRSRSRHRSRSRSRSHSPPGRFSDGDFTDAFKMASRWGAVLLIDECDLYLEKRNDTSTQRNKLVSRFLTELEYYPSLLFLTTNRERVLDPAVYSRIHLTINYPALDAPSRAKIWTTFLSHGTESSVSERELDVLASIDVNGRRIRNIVKTTKMMAKRAGRPICFDDVRKVMRITEGLIIEESEPEPEYQDARDPFGLAGFD